MGSSSRGSPSSPSACRSLSQPHLVHRLAPGSREVLAVTGQPQSWWRSHQTVYWVAPGASGGGQSVACCLGPGSATHSGRGALCSGSEGSLCAWPHMSGLCQPEAPRGPQRPVSPRDTAQTTSCMARELQVSRVASPAWQGMSVFSYAPAWPQVATMAKARLLRAGVKEESPAGAP